MPADMLTRHRPQVRRVTHTRSTNIRTVPDRARHEPDTGQLTYRRYEDTREPRGTYAYGRYEDTHVVN
eukprot:3235270-Prymnesium_polylepis.2